MYFHTWGFGIGRLHVTWSDLWLKTYGHGWFQTHGLNVLWERRRKHTLDSRPSAAILLNIGGKLWKENP